MVREIAANHFQSLNDRFADPSGKSDPKAAEIVAEGTADQKPDNTLSE